MAVNNIADQKHPWSSMTDEAQRLWQANCMLHPELWNAIYKSFSGKGNLFGMALRRKVVGKSKKIPAIIDWDGLRRSKSGQESRGLYCVTAFRNFSG